MMYDDMKSLLITTKRFIWTAWGFAWLLPITAVRVVLLLMVLIGFGRYATWSMIHGTSINRS